MTSSSVGCTSSSSYAWLWCVLGNLYWQRRARILTRCNLLSSSCRAAYSHVFSFGFIVVAVVKNLLHVVPSPVSDF